MKARLPAKNRLSNFQKAAIEEDDLAQCLWEGARIKLKRK